ncbi:Uncharacterised protein [Raoultella planticola]|nr:Uncharacterised protein [Raoultella planticola]
MYQISSLLNTRNAKTAPANLDHLRFRRVRVMLTSCLRKWHLPYTETDRQPNMLHLGGVSGFKNRLQHSATLSRVLS